MVSKMDVQIKELTDEFFPLFEQYLKGNKFMNACILRDIYCPNLRKRCKFYLTLRNKDIVATLMIHRPPNPKHPPSIWLLGSKEFSSKLCDVIHEDKATIHTTLENSVVIEKKFPNAVRYTADIMVLQKGDEKLSSRYTVKQVNPGEYIEERILLAGETPNSETIELWRKWDEEKIDTTTYLGFADNVAVSTSSASRVVDNIWLIGWTYTKPEYRRQGYAICTLSKAVRDVFEKFNGHYATLFVLGHNEPAKTLYYKVGFNKAGEMVWWEHNVDFLAKTTE